MLDIPRKARVERMRSAGNNRHGLLIVFPQHGHVAARLLVT